MAKFTGQIFGDVQGGLGGSSFSRNSFGKFSRAKVSHSVSFSQKSLGIRSNYSVLVGRWNGLSEYHKNYWKVLAHNKCQHFSGFNYFMSQGLKYMNEFNQIQFVKGSLSRSQILALSSSPVVILADIPSSVVRVVQEVVSRPRSLPFNYNCTSLPFLIGQPGYVSPQYYETFRRVNPIANSISTVNRNYITHVLLPGTSYLPLSFSSYQLTCNDAIVDTIYIDINANGSVAHANVLYGALHGFENGDVCVVSSGSHFLGSHVVSVDSPISFSFPTSYSGSESAIISTSKSGDLDYVVSYVDFIM